MQAFTARGCTCIPGLVDGRVVVDLHRGTTQSRSCSIGDVLNIHEGFVCGIGVSSQRFWIAAYGGAFTERRSIAMVGAPVSSETMRPNIPPIQKHEPSHAGAGRPLHMLE